MGNDKKIKYSPLISALLLYTGLILLPVPLACQSVFPLSAAGIIRYTKIIKPTDHSLQENINRSHKVFDQIKGETDTEEKGNFNALSGDFTRSFIFTVYQKGLITKNPAGQVEGVASLNILSDSILFQIQDLQYAELKKDRYVQFKPGTGKWVPLEKTIKLHHSNEWQAIFSQINGRLNETLDNAEKMFRNNVP